MSPGPSLERDSLILIHAPVGRDARLLHELLHRAKLQSQVCLSIEQLCAEVAKGAGAIFVTEEALEANGIESLASVLQQQGQWSDLPLVVLTIGGEPTQASRERLERLEPLGDLTLLERPLRSDTIVSAARTALRARAKQYEVRRRDAELQLVTDNVPVLISYLDTAQVYRRVNQTYYEWFGKRPEQIVGHTVKSVIGEPHYSVARPYLARALAGERVSFESRLLDKNQRLRYVSVSYAPDVAPNGDVRGIVELLQDITERKGNERRNAFLVQLDDATRSLTDPEAITLGAARLLCEYLDANRCAYAAVEEDQDTFNLTGDHNRGVASIVGRYRFADFGDECLRLMRQGEPFVVEDAETDPRTADSIQAFRSTAIRSVICVPLRKEGRLVAAMAVHQKSPRRWLEKEVELVELVASRCWESIERARAVRELRASEVQFRTLANAIPNLAWMAYPDGHIFWYNQRWFTYTGTSPEAMDGWGWQSVHDPEILPRVLENWKASIESGEPFEMIYPIRAADGTYRPFLTRIEPVKGASGRVVRWFGTNTDIAQQQEAEQRLRAAVLGSPFPIMLHADDGEVLALSRSWTELTGYTREEIRTEQDWIRLAYPDGHGKLGRQFAMFAGSQITHFGEVGVRTKLGDERVWDFHAVPLGRLSDGRRLQMSAAVDVTERSRVAAALREREQELRRTNEELMRANSELEEFAYVSSHDLQEPLRMVNSYTQLLLKRLGPQADADQLKFAEYIRTGIRRMEALIRDLLSYSRATHAENDTPVGTTDLSAALRLALNRVDARIQENKAEVTFDPLPQAMGDEGQLSHVFQNLLSNALKYRSEDELPRIRIKAEQVNGNVVVSVQDNGIGFDPVQSERIFGLFKRLHREEEYPGTGLGLAICKRIVERYGGMMWAKSEEGAGATFFISLPGAHGE